MTWPLKVGDTVHPVTAPRREAGSYTIVLLDPIKDSGCHAVLARRLEPATRHNPHTWLAGRVDPKATPPRQHEVWEPQLWASDEVALADHDDRINGHTW